ncbi:MAG: NDP-sugar synthase [Verrucomicrobia bacterium]|nr:NDP-sugar synthase [Verrucomicrobiota bacterium]
MINSRVRKAFVLGAGLGTRLRPITTVVPKPLLPIFGKPIITFAFDHLISLGVEHIIVNTHYLSENFLRAFPSNYRTVQLELVYEKIRLETGGAIKNVECRIGNEPFFVYSGDILTDIDLDVLLREHFDHQNEVTLALRSTGLAASVGFEPQTARVTAFMLSPLASKESGYDFAGVSIWNPSIFNRIPSGEPLSLISILMGRLKDGGKIGGVVLEENEWFNIGTRADFLRAYRTIYNVRWWPAYIEQSDSPAITRIDDPFSNIKILGASYVEPTCQLGGNITLQDSIILSGSSLRSGTSMKCCVVAGATIQAGEYQNADFA